MSDVQKAPLILAIGVSDLHFSHTPPICRAGEPDWYAAMEATVTQLKKVWEEAGEVPIVLGGDIFDKWNPPYELTLFVWQQLARFAGKVYAIPGQHDLPNHSLDQMHRSAYGVLAESGVIHDLSGFSPRTAQLLVNGCELAITGFPWGCEPSPRDANCDADFALAVAHRYAWAKPSQAYVGAGDAGLASSHDFAGYDWVLYGDNHVRWQSGNRANPGCFMRRHSPDVEHRPGGYRFLTATKPEPFYFDTTQDAFDVADVAPKATSAPVDVEAVLTRLEALTHHTGDARELVLQLIEKTPTTPAIKDKMRSTINDA